jgi:hypothetical protein
MVRYPLNGRPAAFYRGDWFVGKGVACARIRIGPGRRDVAEVFTTHVRRSPMDRVNSLTLGSSMPRTRRNRTTPTSVTERHKHGK